MGKLNRVYDNNSYLHPHFRQAGCHIASFIPHSSPVMWGHSHFTIGRLRFGKVTSLFQGL